MLMCCKVFSLFCSDVITSVPHQELRRNITLSRVICKTFEMSIGFFMGSACSHMRCRIDFKITQARTIVIPFYREKGDRASNGFKYNHYTSLNRLMK